VKSLVDFSGRDSRAIKKLIEGRNSRIKPKPKNGGKTNAKVHDGGRSCDISRVEAGIRKGVFSTVSSVGKHRWAGAQRLTDDVRYGIFDLLEFCNIDIKRL
jgi:hypothetical protein